MSEKTKKAPQLAYLTYVPTLFIESTQGHSIQITIHPLPTDGAIVILVFLYPFGFLRQYLLSLKLENKAHNWTI